MSLIVRRLHVYMYNIRMGPVHPLERSCQEGRDAALRLPVIMAQPTRPYGTFLGKTKKQLITCSGRYSDRIHTYQPHLHARVEHLSLGKQRRLQRIIALHRTRTSWANNTHLDPPSRRSFYFSVAKPPGTTTHSLSARNI